MDNIPVTQPSMNFTMPVGLAAIHLSPVLKPKPFRCGEDWTGTTSPQVRRKLQNRINQRAARIRKSKNQSRLEKPSRLDDPAIPVIPKSASSTQGDFINIPQASNIISTTKSPSGILDSAQGPSPSAALTKPSKHPDSPCINSSSHRNIMLARDFNNWLAYYRKRNIVPFSSDHLLTLMFFNVVRAHTINSTLLGLTAELLAGDTISPFNINSPLSSNLPKSLPPAFYPTHIQRTIPHHPEADVIPWPQLRDNLILARDSYDDYDFCEDMIGVNCSFERQYGEGEEERLRTLEVNQPRNEPGLIVWNDPWKPESWEASESFVKKWGWLLVGCRELLESTNYWREKRGEERLVWEV